MRIPGRWRDGFVLDYHTTGSIYVGDDEYGHPVFDTKRTELGELLYRLKYRADKSVVPEIVAAAQGFLQSRNPGATFIVPVPPSREDRPQQPVLLLAATLGQELGVPVRPDAVRRAKRVPQLNNVYDYDARIRLLKDAHEVDGSVTSGQVVLLFDDLYRSGAIMNAIAHTLYDAGQVSDLVALALTRTRTKA
jgi:predicted amidophosphoribosyltransferase